MKKRFISRKSRNTKRVRLILIISLFLLGIILGFKYLNKSNIKISDKDYAEILLIDQSSKKEEIIKEKYLNKVYDYVKKPLNYLEGKYLDKEEVQPVIKQDEDILLPEVYIYNSHQSEEYLAVTYAEFSVNPTVMVADYILEDSLKKDNIYSIVEERKIKDVLNQNNWNYSNSYRASRIYLEDVVLKYPSLKYFIDIHRDSLTRDKTTITIGDKSYARIVFIVGLENENYNDNLEFTTIINNIIDNKYPGLSKGIYQKGGEGVNGIYNQDFSGSTILVEIGGFENNTTEVLNTTIAFSECFKEAIDVKTDA